MEPAIANFAIPPERVFTDLAACLAGDRGRPGRPLRGAGQPRRATSRRSPRHGAHILVEKPFAASVAERAG